MDAPRSIRQQLAELRASNDVLLALGVWQAAEARQLRAWLKAIGRAAAISDEDRAVVESMDEALDANLRHDLERQILQVGDSNPAVAEYLRAVIEAYGLGTNGNKP